MCTLCQALDPSNYDADTHSQGNLGDGGISDSFSPTNDGGAKPFYTNDQVADYLTDGFWSDTGRSGRSFDVQTGGTITYNINGLDSQGKAAALEAMESWSSVSGLNFAAASNAMMTFDDNQSGAYNSSTTSGNTIISSNINVSTQWRQYGDYYLQTFIHEIGHAIGLGHTGDYNGSASYASDAHFENDSWQVSVMSYFDQNQNTTVDASRLFLATAQQADILAVQALYGTATTVRTGDTVYGDSENTGQFGMDLPGNKVVAILDNGGTDHINLASRSNNQRLNLNTEVYSDLNGYTGNFSIARGSVIENATTGAGDDFITGNSADNTLSSGAGADTLFGNGGDDVLIGGAGADILTGGVGADRFAYAGLGDGGDTITDFDLSQGDRMDITDVLAATGYSGTDPVADGIVALHAGSGGSWLVVDNDGAMGGGTTQIAFLTGISASASVADIIDVETGGTGGGGGGGGGNPTSGADTLYEFTNDFAIGWTTQRGVLQDVDGGTDTIDVSGVTTTVRIYLDSSKVGRLAGKRFEIATGTEIENLVLGVARDTAVGNAADNHFDGGEGDDKLYGLGGADTLVGSDGRDRLYGGEGADTLEGGIADDRLYGGEGDDILIGADGRDRLYGGAGNDSLAGGAGDDYYWGDEGDDIIIGGIGRDRIDGGAGDDVLDGGSDADRIKGGDGDDEITGGEAADTLEGGDGNDDLSGGAGVDRIKGNDGDDIIDGGADADRIYGDNGNDQMFGGGGDDRVYGGAGDDDLSGGDGRDKIYGDRGNDTLTGGAGVDSLFGGTDNDVLYGNEGNDLIFAHAGDDWVEGGDGDDRILADRGDDNVTGGAGNDKIGGGTDDDRLFGNEGMDEIKGDSGDDLLDGGAGDDELEGGTGDDRMIGGAGMDELRGGSGSDTFVFEALSDGGDVIKDFSSRSDVLDISALLADLGTMLADAIAGEVLLLEAHGRGAMLRIDTDGAGEDASPIDLVYLERFDEDSAMDTGWII